MKPEVGNKATVSDRTGVWEVEKYDPDTGEGVLVAYSKVEIPFSPGRNGTFTAYNNAEIEFIDTEAEPNDGPCFCCTYGNHDIRCTCDGTGCCHPDAYKDYNPSWGHGTRAT